MSPDRSVALKVGDRVRTRDGQEGQIKRIFETPWDTVAQGEDHTRTVAHVEDLNAMSPVSGDWFLDHLEAVE